MVKLEALLCCDSLKVATLIVLYLCVLINMYIFGIELVELKEKLEKMDLYEVYFLLFSPIIEVMVAVTGIYGIKTRNPLMLLPFLYYKTIYTFIYIIILFILPFSVSTITSWEFIDAFHHQFQNNIFKKNNLSVFVNIGILLFASMCPHPLKKIVDLPNSASVVVLIYTLYLFSVTVIQAYFVTIVFNFYFLFKNEINPPRQMFIIPPDDANVSKIAIQIVSPSYTPSSSERSLYDPNLEKKIDVVFSSSTLAIN